MKAAEWIDLVKVKNEWSDYRVAKELGFSPNTISTYRKSGGPMDEGIALKIAHTLGENPGFVLADQAMERAKNTEARSAWETILEIFKERNLATADAVVVGAPRTVEKSGSNNWRKRTNPSKPKTVSKSSDLGIVVRSFFASAMPQFA